MECNLRACRPHAPPFLPMRRQDIAKLIGDTLGRPVDPAKVFGRPSKKGKYISANVIVKLESGDEVIAVYNALKSDKRVVWYL